VILRVVVTAFTAALFVGLGYGIYAVDQFRSHAIANVFATFRPPPTPVAAADAKLEDVPKYLQAIGSLAAVHQVTVTSEVGGLVTAISFEPGATVKAGDVLVSSTTGRSRPTCATIRPRRAMPSCSSAVPRIWSPARTRRRRRSTSTRTSSSRRPPTSPRPRR